MAAAHELSRLASEDETRSYWGDSVRCGACYVGLGHTQEQHAARVGAHKHWPDTANCTRCTVDLDN